VVSIYLATLTTLKRLLTGVGPQMLLQQSAVHVGLVTEATLHHVARMYPHVHPQSSQGCIPATTRVTNVCPVTGNSLSLLLLLLLLLL